MAMNQVYKVMVLRKMKYVTSKQIDEFCKAVDVDTAGTIRNLQSNGYLVRILRGIFYVRDLEEAELGRNKISPFDLLREGLELKRVDRWYLGLQSALKMNGMTHEITMTEYVLNDKIFRQNPMNIAGMDVHFVKLKRALFDFGIICNPFPHSDPEKTILDMIYLDRYNGRKDTWIESEVSEYLGSLDKMKIREYSGYYPKTVRISIAGMV